MRRPSCRHSSAAPLSSWVWLRSKHSRPARSRSASAIACCPRHFGPRSIRKRRPSRMRTSLRHCWDDAVSQRWDAIIVGQLRQQITAPGRLRLNAPRGMPRHRLDIGPLPRCKPVPYKVKQISQYRLCIAKIRVSKRKKLLGYITRIDRI